MLSIKLLSLDVALLKKEDSLHDFWNTTSKQQAANKNLCSFLKICHANIVSDRLYVCFSLLYGF